MFRFLGHFTATHPGKICAAWLLLVLTPGLMALQFNRNLVRQRYGSARRWAGLSLWKIKAACTERELYHPVRRTPRLTAVYFGGLPSSVRTLAARQHFIRR